MPRYASLEKDLVVMLKIFRSPVLLMTNHMGCEVEFALHV